MKWRREFSFNFTVDNCFKSLLKVTNKFTDNKKWIGFPIVPLKHCKILNTFSWSSALHHYALRIRHHPSILFAERFRAGRPFRPVVRLCRFFVAAHFEEDGKLLGRSFGGKFRMRFIREGFVRVRIFFVIWFRLGAQSLYLPMASNLNSSTIYLMCAIFHRLHLIILRIFSVRSIDVGDFYLILPYTYIFIGGTPIWWSRRFRGKGWKPSTQDVKQVCRPPPASEEFGFNQKKVLIGQFHDKPSRHVCIPQLVRSSLKNS